MKKILLLLPLLLLTTSFSKQKDIVWVATFEIFVDDNGDAVIYYKGNVDHCTAKRIIEFVYVNCDTVPSVEDVKLDTVTIKEKKPKNITRT
jgi:hypothetical protein